MRKNGYDLKYVEKVLREVVRRGKKKKNDWKDMMGEERVKAVRYAEKLRRVEECAETDFNING